MPILIAFNDLIMFSSQDDPRSNDIKRSYHHDNLLSDLKFKIPRNDRHLEDFNLPPYLRKKNRRFKALHETMHENDWAKKSSYGHVEYQQFLHKNEIPETDLIAELLHKSLKRTQNDHKHHKKHQHHYSRSHHKIKKYRSKPEVGIMQRKLKLVQ